MAASLKSVLALDVGAKRVGVALASRAARLPQPLTTVAFNDMFFTVLKKIVLDEGVDTFVIGYPRGLEGQHTSQTNAIESFTNLLRQHFELPIHWQDEALTSRHAEAELQARGKTYDKAAIDALAATYILEDFLIEHPDFKEVSA